MNHEAPLILRLSRALRGFAQDERKLVVGFSLALSIAILAAPTSALSPAESEEFFRANCASCHTIGGGRLTGPDLKDVVNRKDKEWLSHFMQDPQAVIASGDPYAQKLVEEARAVIMPRIAGMNKATADAMLELMIAESAKETSLFAGSRLSDRPLTPADVAEGERIFMGSRPLVKNGPACIACHSVEGLRGLGGGKLGPDLTQVYNRLGGRQSFSAWLAAPATPVMQPLFKKAALEPDEILALVAFFRQKSTEGTGEEDSSLILNFIVLGGGGLLFGLVIFDRLWKNRFRGVRIPMVRGEQS